MRKVRWSVPTYLGSAHSKQAPLGELPDFGGPSVPVLIQESDGVRIVLGTHECNDLDKADIQVERRPKGWAIFLHPVGGGDPCGYVYFLDDGRSFLLRERDRIGNPAIKVLPATRDVPDLDEIDSLPADASFRSCARCGRLTEYCDDWFGELCPTCADETEGDWVCRRCDRRGTFEEMGGCGVENPACCGCPCRHVYPGNSAD